MESKYSDTLIEDDKLTEIILVRHGQTEWNVIHRLQGQGNSELTKIGLCGAKKVGQKLYSLHKNGSKQIDFVYSSPLKRAKQTAEIMMKQFIQNGDGMDITFDDRIMERHFGDNQGMLYANINKDKNYDKMNYAPPGDGAESFQDVIDRTTEFIAEIAAKHQGKRILVVAHGGVLQAIMNDILSHSTSKDYRFYNKNCAINIIERRHCDGRWIVSVLGDDNYGDYQTVDKRNDSGIKAQRLSYLFAGVAIGCIASYVILKRKNSLINKVINAMAG